MCCVYSPSPTSPPTHVVTAHSGDCRAVLTSELRPPEGTVGGSKALENLSQVEDGWEVGGKRKREEGDPGGAVGESVRGAKR